MVVGSSLLGKPPAGSPPAGGAPRSPTYAEVLTGHLALHEPALKAHVRRRAQNGDGGGVVVAPLPTGQKVGIVEIDGPLAQRACGFGDWLLIDGYDAVASRLAATLADPQVGAVVLRVDSPGGEVAGAFEGARRMRELVALSKKPVYAFADECACSAAYLLACVAPDGIYVPPTGNVGSVGILGVHVEESRALDAEGVTVNVFRSPERKAEGLPVEKLSAAASKRWQAEIDDLADVFAATVASARGMTKVEVLALEGLDFTGADAVAHKLADGVASFEDVCGMAARSAQERTDRMKVDGALASLLGCKPDATAEEVQAATARVAEVAELGRWALAHTGATTVDAARGTLEARAREAADVGRLRAQVAEQATRVEAEARVRALEAGVVAGKLTPGEAWKDGDKSAGPAPFFANRPAEEIQAYVATCSPRVTAPAPLAKPAGGKVKASALAASLTEHELAIAASLGLSPKKFAKAKRRRAAELAAGLGGRGPGVVPVSRDDEDDDEDEEKSQ